MPATPVPATSGVRSPPWQAPLSAATRQHLARLLVGDMADVPEADAPPSDRPAAPVAGVPAPDLSGFASTDHEVAETGLRHVVLPGVPFPLWLRAGTADARELQAALHGLAEALPVPFAPRRILDLGAGQGYRAVALASAHPEASIAAIEAMPGAWRLLSLNTLPWRQISTLRVAVAAEAGTANLAIGGDGRPRLVPAESGPIPVLALETLYRRLGWDGADLLIVDPAQVAGLEAPAMAAALAAVRMVAIARVPGGPAADSLAALLPGPGHDHRRTDVYDVFLRRQEAAAPAPPRRIALVDFAGTPGRMGLAGLAGAPLPLGDTGFRVAPARPDAPAQVSMVRFLAGPRRFQARLRAGGGGAGSVRLGVVVTALPSQRQVASMTRSLAPGAQDLWEEDLPLFFGDARITLSVDVAAVGQFADWFDPVLL